MSPSVLRTPSIRAGAFVAVLAVSLVWTYWADMRLFALRARRTVHRDLLFRDDYCEALSVLEICRREELVKVLFVVDTELGNVAERSFARLTYGRRSFARPLHWLTVFRMMGQNSNRLPPSLKEECRIARDIVVPGGRYATAAPPLPGSPKTPPTFLAFVPWILEHCPNVDLMVHMHDGVLPHPFYLPNYRVLHMDHQPQVIHCHGTGWSTAACRPSSVLMTKKKGIEALAQNASEQEGHLVTGDLEVRDIASYIALNETMTMLYTIGAVIFYTYPPNLNVSRLSLWNEMMAAPENSPHYLRL
ncbi:uncharacterized protein LOC119400955 [Rhipicephalus sanguineus]|uniref:uncharacterized protein LOC119400955 n=1 Tax=Rhipicephalus sanguineus TaxID=34632 RepID=UPI0020C4AA61|nr:uncharacterized protein LOC119400955 [Rhipicephalus sanguineus]